MFSLTTWVAATQPKRQPSLQLHAAQHLQDCLPANDLRRYISYIGTLLHSRGQSIIYVHSHPYQQRANPQANHGNCCNRWNELHAPCWKSSSVIFLRSLRTTDQHAPVAHGLYCGVECRPGIQEIVLLAPPSDMLLFLITEVTTIPSQSQHMLGNNCSISHWLIAGQSRRRLSGPSSPSSLAMKAK